MGGRASPPGEVAFVNRKERFEKLKAMCDEGLESEQIAKQLGMTRDYCRKELKGRGLCAIDMHTKPGKSLDWNCGTKMEVKE